MKQRIFIWLLIGWLPQCLGLSHHNVTLHVNSTESRNNNTWVFASEYSIPSNVTVIVNVTVGNSTFVGNTTTLERENVTKLQNASVKPSIVCDTIVVNESLQANKSCYPPSAALQCFHDPIFCKKHFTSGKRELQDEKPIYGEYSSLKHQHWFLVIQHGGIAFLFHPCTPQKDVEKLRQVASQCLHRYVLAPYKKLSQDMPLAMVTWGCFYITNKVDASQMRSWIRQHAYSGPASHVHTNGKFQKNLVKQSEVVTDEKDAILCPNKEQKDRFTPTVPSTAKRYTFKRNPESIINNRIIKLNKLKPGLEISANITVTRVETGSAVWAAASLIFLCGILVGWLLYTRQWSSSRSAYKYDPLRNNDSFECPPGQSQFNLLKSSQKIMNTFRMNEKTRDRKDDAKVSLMVPINEEGDDEEEIMFER